MRAMHTIAARWLLVTCVLVVGCNGQQSSTGTTATPPPAATTSGNVRIAFGSTPNPPESGDNTFEVTVTNRDGSAVTDANVAAVFSMPAMPSMNMPAMQSSTALTHLEGGRYRGAGQLSMGGAWNVRITVTRGGTELGSSRFSIVAK